MIQAVYRIYTEDKRLVSVLDMAKLYFDSCTVYRDLIGYYKGTEECGIVIEIIGEDTQGFGIQVRACSEAIKHINLQQEVWYTKHLVTLEKV
jgi:hypothetical protein